MSSLALIIALLACVLAVVVGTALILASVKMRRASHINPNFTKVILGAGIVQLMFPWLGLYLSVDAEGATLFFAFAIALISIGISAHFVRTAPTILKGLKELQDDHGMSK